LKKPIPVSAPLLTDDDRRAVAECLQAGWLSGEGPPVAAFERAFAETFGRRHGVAVSSGTAGLELGVQALGLGPGDDVLVPSLSIISCARAVVMAGARVVPVDCDPMDWNAHLRHFEERATPRTRALMLVHLYGLCADLGPIVDWARGRGMAVIEDASQAHGLSCRGRSCGSFGDVSVLSLYANKLITTGEGGMMLCDAEETAERCRSLRNLCFDASRRFWHEELGGNHRMGALQAALGTPQLRRLPELVRRKRELGEAYRRGLEALPGLQMAPRSTPWAENVYWMFGLTVAPEAPFTRQELTATLEAQGIGTRPFFHGLHEQPALLRTGLMEPVTLPVTESLSGRGFYLPSGLGLSSSQQRTVIEAVTAFVDARA
jgi:perosamine synthetase